MNFLKGIVDGILADDVDLGQVQGVLQRSFIGDSHTEGDDAATHADHLARKLDDIYREERRNCITTLLIRYGEGCVQQLNELLKTNNDTVKTLSKRLEDAYRSLGDFNNELEALTQENVKLQKRNAELTSQIEILSSENVSLKTVISQAEIETKSQESRINDLSELLNDNAATFNKMKSRCEGFAEYATEIKSLKAELETAQAHIKAVIKERNALVDAACNADNRIKEAMHRQDRAIAIAKLMAQETTFLTAQRDAKHQENVDEIDHQQFAEIKQQLAQYKAAVEQLNEENAHLKDVNDKLHNMFADLSNSSKHLKESCLLEAIEALGKRHLKQLKPIQLIFIQPTRVLDLDLDLELISAEMSHVIQKMHPKVQPQQMRKTQQEPVKSAQNTWDMYGREPHDIPAKVNVQQRQETQKLREPTVHAASEPKVNDPNALVSSEPKVKEAWGSDWDLYDEILQEENPGKTSDNTPPMNQPPEVDDNLHAKANLPKSKNVWEDDLDELLKEQ